MQDWRNEDGFTSLLGEDETTVLAHYYHSREDNVSRFWAKTPEAGAELIQRLEEAQTKQAQEPQ